MQFIVSMVRNNIEPGGRDRFSCSSSAWELLIEVAQTFGWKAQGTTYRLPTEENPEQDARHDYRPGSRRDFKFVTRSDATAWAHALSEARKSSHLDAMIGTRPGVVTLPPETSAEALGSANAPFAVVMNEFIQYAFGGAFCFAQAD
jgi:hypothetical protein